MSEICDPFFRSGLFSAYSGQFTAGHDRIFYWYSGRFSLWIAHGIIKNCGEDFCPIFSCSTPGTDDWLDNFVEDRLEFREDFEAAVQESEREMAVGLRPRVRKP